MHNKKSFIAPDKPQGKIRWIIIWLAFLAIAIGYIDRANLSVALPYLTEELDLDPTYSGLILGAFFWTYSLFQFPSGWLADKLGSRFTFAFSVLWWSVFTALTAFARGFYSLLSLRLLLGVGEAGAFPAATRVVEEWFPKHERGFASGIYDSGARGGTMIAIPIVSALVAAVGWKGSFLITGAIGLLWVLIWLKFYRIPREQQILSTEEFEYIKKGGGAKIRDHTEESTIKWRDIAKNRTVWGMSLGFACQSYVIYFFITWFPTYLVQERGFDLLELGIWGTIPGITAFIGNFFGGWVSDKLIYRGFSITAARKTCIVAGMIISGVIGLAGQVESPMAALALLSLSFAGVTFATSSIVALPADISPQEGASIAGSIQGFQNGISNLAGIISPTVIGWLYSVTGEFKMGLLSATFAAFLGCILYIFMVGKIEPIKAGS